VATGRSPLTLLLHGPDAGKFSGGGYLSLLIHAALIAAAIYGTASARHMAPAVRLGTRVVLIGPPEPQHEIPPTPVLDVSLEANQTVVAPVLIVIAIPSVNLQEHFDPKEFTRAGVEVGVEEETATGVLLTADQICDPSVLDDPPILLVSPPLDYPPLERQAGFTGRVVVEAVIDTTGHAEPASVRVIRTGYPAFDQPSREWMLNARFRPGRVRGRPVRVLVDRALDYRSTPSP